MELSTKERIKILDYLRGCNLLVEGDVTYPYFRFMTDGNIIYIQRLAFTWGVLLLDVNVFEHTACNYRFCFPQLSDAKKFFEEAQSITDVPTYGWVAARPEGRLLLPKELRFYTQKKDLWETLPVDLTIEKLIEAGVYDVVAFKTWLKERGGEVDQGVKDFIKHLKRVKC